MSDLILGDCLKVLPTFPNEAFNMIFADPPYYTRHKGGLKRPEGGKYHGVDEDWDDFDNLETFINFNRLWLTECRRVLHKDGTIWITGTFHNIYIIGYLLMELDFWILNDIVWIKANPPPNFLGVRFTHAHENIIWAAKSKKSKHTFNYKEMKEENNNLQMRDDWYLNSCGPSERIVIDGKKLHSSQKPEELLRRIIKASTKEGDFILDPFLGTGTTGKVAQEMGRNFVGIEKEEKYYNVAKSRLSTWNRSLC